MKGDGAVGMRVDVFWPKEIFFVDDFPYYVLIKGCLHYSYVL